MWSARFLSGTAITTMRCGTVWRPCLWTRLIWRHTSAWHAVCLSSSTWPRLRSVSMTSRASFPSRRTAVHAMRSTKTSRRRSSQKQTPVGSSLGFVFLCMHLNNQHSLHILESFNIVLYFVLESNSTYQGCICLIRITVKCINIIII